MTAERIRPRFWLAERGSLVTLVSVVIPTRAVQAGGNDPLRAGLSIDRICFFVFLFFEMHRPNVLSRPIINNLPKIIYVIFSQEKKIFMLHAYLEL